MTEKITPKNVGGLRWNGWGYEDTEFEFDQNGEVFLRGDRYLFSGRTFPAFRAWAEETFGLTIDYETPAQTTIDIPKGTINHEFWQAVDDHCAEKTTDGNHRLQHAHGHSMQEVAALRFGSFERIPDAVVWPSSHSDVEHIVALAEKFDVCLIPFGGGTTVSQSLLCPANEPRMIVSLDMRRMNRVLWVDEENLTIKVEAGCTGQQLVAACREHGVRFGHEPDSYEFSSVGGWVATRASGMKKNAYGNIEDLLVSVRFVTPRGTIERHTGNAPRVSAGPDLTHIALGSEGTLGVVTEAVLKVYPLPEVQVYGSIVFPSFEQGVACLRELAKKRVKPASIRLVDNEQFKFGQVLKPGGGSWWSAVGDWAKKIYVTRIRGFDVDHMCAATLVFEGSKDEVAVQEQKVYDIAVQYGGLVAGAENGIRGYFLTYCIAYLRDYGLNYGFLAESFETSCAWSDVLELCAKTKTAIRQQCRDRNCPYEPFVSCRVTQSYDSGACIYFYFGFIVKDIADPVSLFSHVEHEARREVLRCGGSVSHHHGIGSIRKVWLPQTVSAPSLQLLKAIKASLDPKNVFAVANLMQESSAAPVTTPKSKL